MSENKVFYISFYPRSDGSGGALRETMRIVAPHKNHGRLLRMAQLKGKKLQAGSFAIFEQAMPRIWPIYYGEEKCSSCGGEVNP